MKPIDLWFISEEYLKYKYYKKMISRQIRNIHSNLLKTESVESEIHKLGHFYCAVFYLGQQFHSDEGGAYAPDGLPGCLDQDHFFRVGPSAYGHQGTQADTSQ
jgi:hypothetical protein